LYAYDLHELRFVQVRSTVSAADALFVLTTAGFGVVPTNKIWTVLVAEYYPSAAETRSIVVSKYTASSGSVAIRGPQSIALSSTLKYPILTEGNQLILLPGEGLRVDRDAFTAGSTMIIRIQFVESDLPTMKYLDPQKLLSQDRRKRGFARASILGRAAAAFGGHGGEGGEGGEPGGGGGGAIPV